MSQANVVWRVEIWRDSNESSSALGELSFDANESVLIEWGETSKEEPLCPSTATIKVISPADGTYQNLYTIKAGSVGAHIYREGQLYWAGTLDAEFYEEPYEMRDSYVVSLTFSDFGMLDRVPLPLRGIVTLKDVLTTAQQYAALERLTLDISMLSLQGQQGEVMEIDTIAVNADNWRDDTGTYASLKQVLTDMLQPFALRLVSRGGRLYLYDLHGLYTSAKKYTGWAAAKRSAWTRWSTTAPSPSAPMWRTHCSLEKSPTPTLQASATSTLLATTSNPCAMHAMRLPSMILPSSSEQARAWHL